MKNIPQDSDYLEKLITNTQTYYKGSVHLFKAPCGLAYLQIIFLLKQIEIFEETLFNRTTLSSFYQIFPEMVLYFKKSSKLC